MSIMVPLELVLNSSATMPNFSKENKPSLSIDTVTQLYTNFRNVTGASIKRDRMTV